MNLEHEKIKYVFTDNKSENDAILIGYLTAGIENTIKKLLQKQTKTIKVIAIENVNESDLSSSIDDMTSNLIFDWNLCENLFLFRAYNKFTPKMKRIFNNYYLEDKPVAEISEQEHCTKRAINRTLERCREYIKLEKYKEENNARDNN